MLSTGHELCKQLAAALGLADKPIRRIVLEASLDKAVIAYVEMLVERQSSVQVVDLIENTSKIVPDAKVFVGDKGDVNIVQH